MKLRDLYESRHTKLTEATRVLPLTEDRFLDLLQRLQNHIPVEIARDMICDLLDVDELNDQLQYASKKNPNQDARTIIANWLNTNMPSEVNKYVNNDKGHGPDSFRLSPISG